MQKRLFLSAVLGLGLALGTACGDDDESDGSSTPDSGARDASTSADSSAPTDASKADAAKPDASAPTIVELAVADGRFTTLAAAVQRAGLLATLSGPGPLTVFAPTDAAFAKLPAGTLDALSDEQLKQVLLYHAVSGRVLSSSLTAGPVDTVAELSAFVSTTGGVKVNNANVTSADITASNGVIHVLDTVLLPPNLVEAAQYAGSFTSLVGAVQTANLTEALTDSTAKLTVFAPTDTAFAALPPGTVAGLSQTQLADLLKYHVLPTEVLSTQLTAGAVSTLLTGKQVTISLTGGAKVNDANVIITDVKTTNGVIHAIDKVLTPPN